MVDPRTWTLHDADDVAISALRKSGDDPTVSRPVTVQFSGEAVSGEYFQRDMATTGWEIADLPTTGGNSIITMEWETTSDDDALRDLSLRLHRIAGTYGVQYLGWSVPYSSTFE